MKARKLSQGAASLAGGILGLGVGLVSLAIYLFFTGAFIVLGIYIFHAVINHFHHSNPPIKSLYSTAYYATQDSFQINFPGTPTITQVPSSQTNGVAGGNSYDFTSGDKTAEYDVSVVTFAHNITGLSQQQQQNGLQQDLNYQARSNNVAVKSSEFITFDNYTALQASLSSSSNGIAYEILFYDNNREIVILGTGISKGSFESFASTFKDT